MGLIKENDFLKSEIALMKENIEQTVKHMESIDDQLTRLKNSILANVKYTSNNIERLRKLCEQEINVETSLLRRLQAQTISDATQTLGKIPPFTKIAVTFDPMKQFRCPLRFRIPPIVYFMTSAWRRCKDISTNHQSVS